MQYKESSFDSIIYNHHNFVSFIQLHLLQRIFHYAPVKYCFCKQSWFSIDPTQETFNCSKSTMETLKKVWNMVKVNNKNSRTIMPDVVVVYFTPFFMVSIIDFEQVNVCVVLKNNIIYLGFPL